MTRREAVRLAKERVAARISRLLSLSTDLRIEDAGVCLDVPSCVQVTVRVDYDDPRVDGGRVEGLVIQLDITMTETIG